uniref:Neuronal membrane glycoprotein M6-b n=1 Tax=Parastrongyloides trichosuri TaxID=131310 RepID=A0A0N5A332_PARTI
MYQKGIREDLQSPPIPLKSQKDGCVQRVPYASIMATVTCFIGVIMFAVMMVWSFKASVEQSRRALHIDNLPWLDKVHIFFIVLASIMVLFSLFMLILGIMSTGSTREELYKQSYARKGGRCSCIIGMVLSYFLNICWLIIISATAILSFIYYVFLNLCSSLPSYGDSNCLNFALFKPLVKEYTSASLILCGGDAQQFCALTNSVFPWYIVGYIGSGIVSLGLTQFMICNAANYAHINNDKRYVEIKEVLMYEGQKGDYNQVMPTYKGNLPILRNHFNYDNRRLGNGGNQKASYHNNDNSYYGAKNNYYNNDLPFKSSVNMHGNNNNAYGRRSYHYN